jgi:hypothetical protein
MLWLLWTSFAIMSIGERAPPKEAPVEIRQVSVPGCRYPDVGTRWAKVSPAWHRWEQLPCNRYHTPLGPYVRILAFRIVAATSVLASAYFFAPTTLFWLRVRT